MRLFALAALTLAGLLAAAALSLAPAAADGHDRPELIISLVEDSDNVVPPGSVFNVRAQVRYDTPSGDVRLSEILDGSHLRLAGPLDWDDTSIGAAFTIPPEIFGVPATEIIPMDGASPPMPFDTNAASPGVAATGVWPVAYGSRTLVAYAGTTNGSLLVFDTKADPPAQVAKIDGAAGERLLLGVLTRIVDSRAAAVWDQDDTTAWIFAGAPDAGTDDEGKLYIYKLTYTASGATVGTPTVLTPPSSEYTNRNQNGPNQKGYYGRSISISADGQTLAVGASGMNQSGAVYVYTMPDGDGEDWSDITYAVGVKVTPVQVPSWGTATAAHQPFDETSTNTGGAYNQCDAYCSSAAATFDSHFGNAVELSADGATLVVAAPNKRFASNTPGGVGFTTPTTPIWAGSVWVFTAPEGGWSAAPDATTGKTLIAAAANAGSWDPTMHYSPGPAKRIESADAELTPAAWGATRTAQEFFGHPVNISADGETIVATARRNASPNSHVYIFEKPAGGWATSSSPTATIVLDNDDATNDDLAGIWGTDVNHDGRRILIEDAQADRTTPAPTLENAGLVYVFSRPAGGWASSLTEDDSDQIFRSPTPQANGQFSAPLYNNAGTLAVFADTDYNGITGTAPKFFLEEEGIECANSTVDGDPKTTCTIELPNTDVTVPIGTPDGGFTISGSVAVRFSDGTEARNVASSLAASVGTVDELANVEFDFATNTMGDTDPLNDRPYPSVIAPGGSTTLLLKLLNENGKASAKGAAASVLFSTARGSLSARIGAAETEACGSSGGSVCRLSTPATTLTADNADNIRLTVTHPGANKAGSASIRVVVVNAAGRTFSVEPIALTFSGPPTSLAATQPPTALLGYIPPAPPAGGIADDDQRNVATLVVSATDVAGNKAAVPTSRYTAKLTGPDDKTVSTTGTNRQVRVDWPLRVDPDDMDTDLVLRDGNPQAKLTIRAPQTSPLAVGEYTLELSAGSGVAKLTATQTFSVTGGAAALELTADPTGDIAEGATVVITATATDANGEPVPDGTLVTFEEQSTDASATVVLLSQKKQRTRNGQATATLQAVGIGGAYVTAEADGVSGAQSITIAAPPPPPPAERVTSTAADAFTVWTGPQLISASQLLPNLDGVSRIRKQISGAWVSYGETNGLLNSGSVDFIIGRGDVLWLSSN